MPALPQLDYGSLVRSLISLALAFGLPSGVLAHGDFEQRIERANRVAAASPSDPEPRLVRAELFRRHGDFAAALQSLEETRRLSPQLHRIDYFRALVYLDAGRHVEAEATLRRFLERVPSHPGGREAHARALLKLDRPLAAAREYDLVIALQPVSIPEHYVARARAFAAAGTPYLDEAIRGIDEGLVAIGPIVTLERVAIDFELRRGATEAALARIERITKRLPRREMWLARRGEILAQAGRTREAQQSFALALAELEQLSHPKRRTPAMSRLEAELRANLAQFERSLPGMSP